MVRILIPLIRFPASRFHQQYSVHTKTPTLAGPDVVRSSLPKSFLDSAEESPSLSLSFLSSARIDCASGVIYNWGLGTKGQLGHERFDKVLFQSFLSQSAL
jgi:hypothetical protein